MTKNFTLFKKIFTFSLLQIFTTLKYLQNKLIAALNVRYFRLFQHYLHWNPAVVSVHVKVLAETPLHSPPGPSCSVSVRFWEELSVQFPQMTQQEHVRACDSSGNRSPNRFGLNFPFTLSKTIKNFPKSHSRTWHTETWHKENPQKVQLHI